ncbi:DJ-1/PfpI family protein [Paenibacillus radicis (ex Xue et al. 2023)]|uniref:DJ-1/PfpI family protein n=1 Tax=Paenibacillus radicis (ex Xue et al. 2023) TaxID=2972489 RepID=A0ABT1YAP8_9BACL|nr:DJ-1/PfpI family protein [Paenibacillus radicis (ex Xue et al. 2023)]MCR8630266.1 DJ-1/PfpI family protein [Paenibacillus radicis (ex Xue et al. 2023)]
MKMAFILFDQMTTLDFVGFYDAITRLRILKLMEDVSWDVCATQSEVTDELGIKMKIEHVSPDLSQYDLIFVPGGIGTRKLKDDVQFLRWLKTANNVQYKVSVCTGALLLGAAGFLSGRRATTNPQAYDFLEPYCEEVVRARIVRDGNVITGGGVATSIDLGLYLLEYFTDAETVRKIQKSMDYPYYQTGKLDSDYIY